MSSTIHTHKCGFDLEREREGCGATWEHDGIEMMFAATRREYEQGHTCPKCGRGLWLHHYDGETIEVAKQLGLPT